MSRAILIIIFFVLLTPVQGQTEENQYSLTGELTNGLKRLRHESVDLVTTPFLVENGNLFKTVGVLSAAALVYSFDRDIQKNLQAEKNGGLNKAGDVGALVGDPFLHLGISALIYGGAVAADSVKWKQTGEMMGEALILADSSTFVIKEAVGRGRPNVTASRGDFRPMGFKNNYDSLPSMHTASSFAMASIIAPTTENLLYKAGIYTAATFVGFSRVYQNKHWASDIVIGAAIGELSGRVASSFHKKERIALAPQIFENGAGLALVGKW